MEMEKPGPDPGFLSLTFCLAPYFEMKNNKTATCKKYKVVEMRNDIENICLNALTIVHAIVSFQPPLNSIRCPVCSY